MEQISKAADSIVVCAYARAEACESPPSIPKLSPDSRSAIALAEAITNAVLGDARTPKAGDTTPMPPRVSAQTVAILLAMLRLPGTTPTVDLAVMLLAKDLEKEIAILVERRMAEIATRRLRDGEDLFSPRP